MSYEFGALCEMTKVEKKYLLLCSNSECTKNFSMPTTLGRQNERHSWLIDLMCKKCKSKWYICSECSNVKTQFLTKNQIKLHQYKKHKNNNYRMNNNDVISWGKENLENLASASEPTSNNAIDNNHEFETDHITKKKIICITIIIIGSVPKFRTKVKMNLVTKKKANQNNIHSITEIDKINNFEFGNQDIFADVSNEYYVTKYQDAECFKLSIENEFGNPKYSACSNMNCITKFHNVENSELGKTINYNVTKSNSVENNELGNQYDFGNNTNSITKLKQIEF